MKLSNSQRTLAIAAAAILMSTYQLSPLPAWACTAASGGEFAYSSNTGPTSVTVCAKSVTTTRTVATTTKAPATKVPVSKAPANKAPVTKAPVEKPKPSPAAAKVIAFITPIKKGVPIALQKPVSKPIAKPAPKPVAATSTPKAPVNKGATSESSSTDLDEISFTPAPIYVSSSASSADLGQAVDFWANAATHYKSGVLLGKITDVRFIPIQTVWSTDQGQSGTGASISLAFEASGSVEVAAVVTYAVAYQIAGASDWVSSGNIDVSDSVRVNIEALSEGQSAAVTPSRKVVRLVGKNCFLRADAFGCNP